MKLMKKTTHRLQPVIYITIFVIIGALFFMLYLNSKASYNEVATNTISDSDTGTSLGVQRLNVYFVDKNRNLIDQKVYTQSFSTVEALSLSAIELEYDMEAYKSFESYYIDVQTTFPKEVYKELNNETLIEPNRYKVYLGVVDLTKIETGDYPITITLFYKVNNQSDEKNATLKYSFSATRG